MSDVTVAVIGGSLVGTTAALFMQAQGLDAFVFERHEQAHTRSGGVIGLEHPALQALEQVGITQPEIIPVPTETVLSVTLSGGVVLERAASLYPGRTTTWTRLYRAAVARLQADTYMPGYSLYNVTESPTGARLHFTNGQTVTADVVIFADGRKSIGRTLFDPDRRLHYAGYVAHAGEYPDCPPDLADAFVRLHTNGSLFNTMPTSPPDGPVVLDWRFYVNETAAHYAHLFRAGPEDELAGPDELTYVPPAKVTDQARQFVDAAARLLLPEREADIVTASRIRSAAPVLDVEAPTRLVYRVGRSRVVLASDAAGPMHPSAARGANAGLEQMLDLSVVLHQHFHNGANLDAGLKAYEHRQLPPFRCALREGPILGARMGLGVWA